MVNILYEAFQVNQRGAETTVMFVVLLSTFWQPPCREPQSNYPMASNFSNLIEWKLKEKNKERGY